MKDTLVRAPAWMLNLRPRLAGYIEPQRQHADLKPQPPRPGRDARKKKGGG